MTAKISRSCYNGRVAAHCFLNGSKKLEDKEFHRPQQERDTDANLDCAAHISSARVHQVCR